jgi:hypothetical protein
MVNFGIITELLARIRIVQIKEHIRNSLTEVPSLILIKYEQN